MPAAVPADSSSAGTDGSGTNGQGGTKWAASLTPLQRAASRRPIVEAEAVAEEPPCDAAPLKQAAGPGAVAIHCLDQHDCTSTTASSSSESVAAVAAAQLLGALGSLPTEERQCFKA